MYTLHFLLRFLYVFFLFINFFLQLDRQTSERLTWWYAITSTLAYRRLHHEKHRKLVTDPTPKELDRDDNLSWHQIPVDN